MSKAIFNISLVAFALVAVMDMILGKPIPTDRIHRTMDVLVFMGVVYLVEKY